MPLFEVLIKEVGETPLQALEKFRVARPEFAELPLTYAGRLDPMAEGKLIILIGDECKKRDKYTGLDKEYEFEILFGVSSDTGDVLGLADSAGKIQVGEKEIKSAVSTFVGKRTVSYPAFSSKTVDGKHLFEHALSGSIKKIKIPSVDIEVYGMRFLGLRAISCSVLLEEIVGKINTFKVDANDTRLGSDFRKDDILARWNSAVLTEQSYVIAKFKTVVSSGTYIRSLAPLIAKKLGMKGLAYSIRRTKIGRFHNVFGKWGFWTHRF